MCYCCLKTAAEWLVFCYVDPKWNKGEGEMTITDNGGYVKQAAVGLLGLLMAQSAASAESKFLSL